MQNRRQKSADNPFVTGMKDGILKPNEHPQFPWISVQTKCQKMSDTVREFNVQCFSELSHFRKKNKSIS